MGSFETVDYIFIIIVLLSTLFGVARGFIREAFTLANIVIAALFTFFFYGNSYSFFAKQFTSNTVTVLFSTFGVFIVIWIIIAIINSFLVDALGKAKGSGFDRLMGLAFGLLRGALIVIAIYLGVAMGYKAQEDQKNMPEWMSHAATYNFVKMQSQAFVDMMPEKFQKIYKSGSDHLVTNVVESLSPHGLLSDEERKMLDYGLTIKNTDTLKQILHQLPPAGNTPDFYTLGKLPKMEFKAKAISLVEEYDRELESKRIPPTIPAQNVESLKKSLNSIEEDKEDLYKGLQEDKTKPIGTTNTN